MHKKTGSYFGSLIVNGFIERMLIYIYKANGKNSVVASYWIVLLFSEWHSTFFYYHRDTGAMYSGVPLYTAVTSPISPFVYIFYQFYWLLGNLPVVKLTTVHFW